MNDPTPEPADEEILADAAPAVPDDGPAEDNMSAKDVAAGDVAEDAATRLAAETARADELAERIKRMEADFVNETRRMRERSAKDAQYAIERVIVDLVPLLDSFHQAAASLGEGDTDATEAMAEGLGLVRRQLEGVLAKHGVTEIEAEGQPFDPARHEALFTEPRDDVVPQTVVRVLRPGFLLHDRVVRAAEVAVAVAPPASANEAEDAPVDGED